jgi:hypothetical protein
MTTSTSLIPLAAPTNAFAGVTRRPHVSQTGRDMRR